MQLKEIQFVTENCEVICISGESIGYLCVDDIKTSVLRTIDNGVVVKNVASRFTVEVLAQANATYDPFQSGDQVKLFDRLSSRNDISSISIIASDETDDIEFELPWAGSDTHNLLQRTYRSWNGNLVIVVGAESDGNDSAGGNSYTVEL